MFIFRWPIWITQIIVPLFYQIIDIFCIFRCDLRSKTSFFMIFLSASLGKLLLDTFISELICLKSPDSSSHSLYLLLLRIFFIKSNNIAMIKLWYLDSYLLLFYWIDSFLGDNDVCIRFCIFLFFHPKDCQYFVCFKVLEKH